MADGVDEGSAAMRGSLCPDPVARRKERLLKKWGRGGHLSDEEADFLDRHIPFMYDSERMTEAATMSDENE